MITNIEISKSINYQIPYLNSKEFKNQFNMGWGYFYIYHFREFKDIYLAVKEFNFTSLPVFTDLVIRKLKIKPVQTPWDREGRRINEYINAFKKLALLRENNELVDRTLFLDSEIGNELTNNDLTIFKNLFFRYYRFREIMSWFLNPLNNVSRNELIENITEEKLISESKVIYSYSNKSRFNDTFFFELKDNTPIYYINNDDEDFMRFWDVFISWAKNLGLVEKINLKSLNITLSNHKKSITCVYFLSEAEPTFDLYDYIQDNFKSKYINTAKLVINLAIKYRLPIESIKNQIVKQCKEKKNKLSMQRTSRVFIRDKTELNCIPKVNNYYISHIMVI